MKPIRFFLPLAAVIALFANQHVQAMYSVIDTSYHWPVDGSDYSPAIQRAIYAISQTPEKTGTIYFPAGSYWLSEPITASYCLGVASE